MTCSRGCNLFQTRGSSTVRTCRRCGSCSCMHLCGYMNYDVSVLSLPQLYSVLLYSSTSSCDGFWSPSLSGVTCPCSLGTVTIGLGGRVSFSRPYFCFVYLCLYQVCVKVFRSLRGVRSLFRKTQPTGTTRCPRHSFLRVEGFIGRVVLKRKTGLLQQDNQI